MAPNQTGRPLSAYSFICDVSASSTHEINNELAVINEQSRLTAELLAMSRMGHEVDPAELEHLLSRVIARVERADKLVQRMNAFAHSLEQEGASCDLSTCLGLMSAMFGRKAGLKEVSLEIADSSDVIAGLETVACEQLLWTALGACLEASAPCGVLRVSLGAEKDAALVIMKGEFEKTPDLTFMDAWEPFGVTAQTSEGTLTLRLPGAVDQAPDSQDPGRC